MEMDICVALWAFRLVKDFTFRLQQ